MTRPDRGGANAEILASLLHAVLQRIEPGDAGDLDHRHHLLLVLRKGEFGDCGDADDSGHGSRSEELQRFASVHGYLLIADLSVARAGSARTKADTFKYWQTIALGPPELPGA